MPKGRYLARQHRLIAVEQDEYQYGWWIVDTAERGEDFPEGREIAHVAFQEHARLIVAALNEKDGP